MAKRPTVSTITSSYASAVTLNAAIQAIVAAFDNTLSRDGSSPNSMSADLDMNNQDILNVASIQANQFNIGGSALDITDLQTLNNIGADVTTLAHLEDGTVLTNGLSSLAANSDTLVANLSGLNSFAERYNVAASAPDSPAEGDLWYDTINNVMKYYDGSSWQTSAGVSADVNVKVSSNDTTEDFLLNKLAAGSNISLTETNDGSNETITIAVTGLGALATQNTVGTGDYDAGSIVTADVANDAVTYAKMQDVSATDRLLGRDTAGAGIVEELTPTAVKAMLGISTFKSSGITLSTGNQTYTQAHGLSSTPDQAGGYIQCTSTDAGYSVGDRVFLPNVGVISFGGARGAWLTVAADSTNLVCIQDDNITISNKAPASGQTSIDATKWDLYLTAQILS